MKPALKLAIDFTQWNVPADFVTPEQVEAWKAARVTKVVIGAGYHDAAVQQIQACADGGLAVEIYRFLFWSRPTREQVRFALSIAADSGRQIGRLWPDCEDAPTVSATEVIDAIVEAVGMSLDARVRCGLYTRPDWWRAFAGGNTDFSSLPLWYAHYDGKADFHDFQSFGGWRRPAMKQYAQNVPLAGRAVDLNIYWES